MPRIATAECFTHGKVAGELHAFARGYPHEYHFSLDREKADISIVAGMFIPTLEGVRTLLRIEPLEPLTIMDTIKVYEQAQDCVMACRMAEAVMRITGADIGIGTTAGIGRGAVAIAAQDKMYSKVTGIDADLRTADVNKLMQREKSGVFTALHLLEEFLSEGNFPDECNKYM